MSAEIRSSISWKRCGVCKAELGFGAEYFECSVSTCNSGRNPTVFCSLPCWGEHVPVLRHRDAWAEQKRSPSRSDYEREQAGQPASHPASGGDAQGAPRRIVVAGGSSSPSTAAAALPHDILVVASKLKAYVRARSGMNTSDSVLDELSDVIREQCDRAIENARMDGRKTVMDRDFKPR